MFPFRRHRRRCRCRLARGQAGALGAALEAARSGQERARREAGARERRLADALAAGREQLERAVAHAAAARARAEAAEAAGAAAGARAAAAEARAARAEAAAAGQCAELRASLAKDRERMDRERVEGSEREALAMELAEALQQEVRSLAWLLRSPLAYVLFYVLFTYLLVLSRSSFELLATHSSTCVSTGLTFCCW